MIRVLRVLDKQALKKKLKGKSFGNAYISPHHTIILADKRLHATVLNVTQSYQSRLSRHTDLETAKIQE